MGLSAAEVIVAIKARDDASGALDSIRKKAGGLGSALSGVSKIAGGFVLAQGLMAAPGILMSMTQAAADDAASVAKLQKAVENTGYAFEDAGHVFDYYIEQAQKRGFTDDQARDSLALLTAQTGDYKEAQRRFALAQDLARGANIDLATASKLLGKVTEDNVNVLGRYGIAAKEGMTETELFGMVQEKFGGQAEAFATSTAGQMEAAKIQMGELKETIGYALLPVMTKLMQVIADHLPEIRAFVDEGIRRIKDVMEDLAPVAQALWDNFKTGLETIGPPLRDLAKFIMDHKPLLIAAIAAIGAAIVVALGPGAAAILAITGLITLIGYLSKHWDESKKKTVEIWNGIKDFLADNWKTIVQIALAVLFPPGAGLFFIVTHFQAIKDSVLGFIGDIVAAITGLPGTVAGLVGSWFGVARDLGGALFNGLMEGLRQAPGMVGAFLDGIWNAIKTLINQAIDAVNNAIPNSLSGPFGIGIDLPDNPVPHLAAGIRNFRGGLAMVGEQGPELLALPRGSDVYSHRELAGASAGGGTFVNQNYGRQTFNFPHTDPRRVFREIDRQLRGL